MTSAWRFLLHRLYNYRNLTFDTCTVHELYGSLIPPFNSHRETCLMCLKTKSLSKVDNEKCSTKHFRKTDHSDEYRDGRVELSANTNFLD